MRSHAAFLLGPGRAASGADTLKYRHQFDGTDPSCDATGDTALGYSSGSRLAIDETAIDERAGTRGVPIDRNRSGTFETIVGNLNGGFDEDDVAHCGGVLTRLADFDDWQHVVLDPFGAGGGSPPQLDAGRCPAPPSQVSP